MKFDVISFDSIVPDLVKIADFAFTGSCDNGCSGSSCGCCGNGCGDEPVE